MDISSTHYIMHIVESNTSVKKQFYHYTNNLREHFAQDFYADKWRRRISIRQQCLHIHRTCTQHTLQDVSERDALAVDSVLFISIWPKY
jgi:hypothetical protein